MHVCAGIGGCELRRLLRSLGIELALLWFKLATDSYIFFQGNFFRTRFCLCLVISTVFWVQSLAKRCRLNNLQELLPSDALSAAGLQTPRTTTENVATFSSRRCPDTENLRYLTCLCKVHSNLSSYLPIALCLLWSDFLLLVLWCSKLLFMFALRFFASFLVITRAISCKTCKAHSDLQRRNTLTSTNTQPALGEVQRCLWR